MPLQNISDDIVRPHVMTRPVDKDVNNLPFTIEVKTDAAAVRNDRLPHNSTHVLEEITTEAHGDAQSVDLEQVAPSVALTANHANSSHDASQVAISQPHTSKNVQNDLDFEGEKNHKKGGLNCVFGNFFFYVLENYSQVQSLK